MSSVPPTPAETSLPTKKRVVASKSDQREVIVEFRSKELDDEMMHWLIQVFQCFVCGSVFFSDFFLFLFFFFFFFWIEHSQQP